LYQASFYRGGDGVDDDAGYLAIGRQVGRFIRMSERLFASVKIDNAGRGLERPAYMLLSRVAINGPSRLSGLAVEACLDLSTVSRQVAALETAGLVRRTADPSDRRASLIEATDTGTEVFLANRDAWLAIWRELIGDWTPEERQTFATLFTQLNGAIADRLPGTGPGTPGERETR
jgi:DNA-binding MarR family transcriptional regulator